MEQPYFSVLVPVYNVEKYLDECVRSVLAQTFADYELILVDDGSTDSSGRMCDAWAEKYPGRIVSVHQENQGLLMARTTGFRHARGRFFVALDSDDTLRSDALELIRDYRERCDADVVIYQISDRADYSNSVTDLPFEDGTVASVAESETLRHRMAATFSMNSLCIKAFRRELAQHQTEKTAHISQGEDLVYSLPIMDRAERVIFCRQSLYYYRPNLSSITRTYKPALFRSLRDALRLQRSYAEKWDGSGFLVKACDTNGLYYFFNDVIVRIMRSKCTRQEKNKYMLEMVTDPDFQRDYAYVGAVPSWKARICLILAKNRCFWPMYLYGMLRNKMAER